MKKLQLKIIVITLLLVVVSCASIKELPKNKYVYKSKNRTLEMYFKDSSTCVLKNTFECPDIDPNFKNITIECNYLRKGDTIFLNSKNLNNSGNLYLDIPPQESINCDFLNKEKRHRASSVAPSYATDYDKYGLVPNINQDTLYIIKNKIVLFKKNKNRSIGFIFKQ
jgi:hypothetical protein